jgi:DNA-binding transcriptional regulator YiaG
MAKEKTFADEVREWRERRGFLQKNAADYLGIPLDTYRAWEGAKTVPHTAPSMGEIRKRMEAK